MANGIGKHVWGLAGGAWLTLATALDAAAQFERSGYFRRLVTYPVVEITPEGGAALDLDNKANLPFVRITLDGTEGDFLLDTGSSHTMVSPDFARRSGIDARRLSYPIQGNVERRRAVFCFVEELLFAESRYRKFHVMVHDFSHLREGLERPIDGILGANVLFAAPFCLNLSGGRYTLIDPLTVDDYPSVNYRRNTRRAQVDAYLDRQRMSFVIDSGSSRSMIGARAWKGRYERAEGETRIDINSGETPDHDLFAVPGDIHIGGTDATGLRFKVAEDHLLGVDFLTRFTLLVDPRERRVAFREEAPAPVAAKAPEEQPAPGTETP